MRLQRPDAMKYLIRRHPDMSEGDIVRVMGLLAVLQERKSGLMTYVPLVCLCFVAGIEIWQHSPWASLPFFFISGAYAMISIGIWRITEELERKEVEALYRAIEVARLKPPEQDDVWERRRDALLAKVKERQG